MKVFHVSPVANENSILSGGLIPDANLKNFERCRQLIYVSPTEASARRWAQEIARETGKLDFSLFEVEIDQNIVFTVTAITELQATIPDMISPENLRLAERFTTTALESVYSSFERGVLGFVYCLECERNVEDNEHKMLDHLEEFHEEYDEDDYETYEDDEEFLQNNYGETLKNESAIIEA